MEDMQTFRSYVTQNQSMMEKMSPHKARATTRGSILPTVIAVEQFKHPYTSRNSTQPRGTGFNNLRRHDLARKEQKVTLLKETFKKTEKSFIGYNPNASMSLGPLRQSLFSPTNGYRNESIGEESPWETKEESRVCSR